MEDLAVNFLDGLYQKAVQSFFDPIKDLFQYFTATPEIISSFAFIDIVHARLRVIGLAILILVAAWQCFKVHFAYLGFECEEPWRIVGRTIIFGFLTFFSKDAMIFVLGGTNNPAHPSMFEGFVNYLWGAMYATAPSGEQLKNLILSLLAPNVAVSIFSWGAIMFIYLTYKFVKLAFRFGERLMITVLIIIASPLGFASGVSQVTKGFMQGMIKLLVGNLVVQLLQIAVFLCIILYRATDPNLLNVFSFVITCSLVKVLEKLEDIVRDASISVGVGRDMSSAIQKIQTTVYSATQVSYAVNAVKKMYKPS